MGNDFVNYEGQLAPNMQLMIGPFNYSEMIKVLFISSSILKLDT